MNEQEYRGRIAEAKALAVAALTSLIFLALAGLGLYWIGGCHHA